MFGKIVDQQTSHEVFAALFICQIIFEVCISIDWRRMDQIRYFLIPRRVIFEEIKRSRTSITCEYPKLPDVLYLAGSFLIKRSGTSVTYQYSRFTWQHRQVERANCDERHDSCESCPVDKCRRPIRCKRSLCASFPLVSQCRRETVEVRPFLPAKQ